MENIVVEEGIACYKQFPLSQQWFLKLSAVDTLKSSLLNSFTQAVYSVQCESAKFAGTVSLDPGFHIRKAPPISDEIQKRE